jgi:hypothetical protein
MGIIEPLLVAFCNDGAIAVKEFKTMANIVVFKVAQLDGFYFFVLGYVFPEFSSAVEFVVCLLAIFEKEVHFDTCRFHVESDKLVGVTLLLRQRNRGCLWLFQRLIERSLSGDELLQLSLALRVRRVRVVGALYEGEALGKLNAALVFELGSMWLFTHESQVLSVFAGRFTKFLQLSADLQTLQLFSFRQFVTLKKTSAGVGEMIDRHVLLCFLSGIHKYVTYFFLSLARQMV